MDEMDCSGRDNFDCMCNLIEYMTSDQQEI